MELWDGEWIIMLFLKSANYEDIEKEWQFQRNIPIEENSFINEYYDISREDFNAALNTMIEQSKGINLPEGYVPQTVFYLLKILKRQLTLS